MTQARLFVGRRFTGISIRPDSGFPDVLWRVHSGDRVSGPMNRTRAKDAAIDWARDGGHRPDAGGTISWHPT